MKGKKHDSESINYGIAIGAIYAHVKTEISEFARSSSIPEKELTTWVGELLSHHASGIPDGTEDRVSRVSNKTTKQAKRSSKVAVASKSRRASSSAAGVGAKAYWAKMSPLQRRREMLRRVAVRKAKQAA